MSPPIERIRNIAVGLVVRDGRALVEIYPATERRGAFARAIGGGIEFGESAHAAVRREFEEELGVAVTHAELVGVTENIFEIDGCRRHEIVHVFAVSSHQVDDLAIDDEVAVLDSHTTVRWVELGALRAENPPFYPVGMATLASAL